jgi:D-erythronate 2-dehydrogenase
MKILILGGGGFLGQKLALALIRLGKLKINGSSLKKIKHLILFDNKMPETVQASVLNQDKGIKIEALEGDICHKKTMTAVLKKKPDVIFHLAAIVSGEAEKNFELGMNVNLHANIQLLEILRALAYCPTLVFTSSCAVFGEDPKDTILDNTASRPKNSYGMQKAVMDLLINDYSRKGFINGRALRLPTIVVRPGKPNAATTSFVSGIMREPLQGKRAICPVDASTPIWILSPKKAVENFIHAAALSDTQLGGHRIINLPGMTVTVADMVNNLEAVAGKKTTDLIDWQPDAFIQSIVLTFPSFFDTPLALALGFKKDTSFKEIIEDFVNDELVMMNHK